MGVRRGSAPRESLSTFFSEESRGPSRPERQVKRSLRGKSQTGKGEREKEKAAHPVSSFAQSRTPAIDFGRRPALSFCFPGQGKCLVSVPCGMEETRRAKAPARPPRTETLEKLSSAPWLFKRFPVSRRFAAEWPLSRPAARKRKRLAAGHRNGVQRGEALLRIFVYFLFGRK